MKHLHLLLGLCVIGTVCVVGDSLRAANFNVMTTNDSGLGSLRQAITQANQASGSHTIHFSGAGASGTIQLASPLPLIRSNIAIHGPGAENLTIRGQDTHRVFFVDSGFVTIGNVTITEGRANPDFSSDSAARRPSPLPGGVKLHDSILIVFQYASGRM